MSMQRTELQPDAYAGDETWRALQQFLPAELRFVDGLTPTRSSGRGRATMFTSTASPGPIPR